MSGIGATNSSASSSSIPGTNVPPVSFPGISSGIDYNSIIQKYTDLTLAQETPFKTQVSQLNAQQAELLKIQDLVAKFQDTFQAISDPAAFTATSPTSSNTSAINASTIAGQVATPGSYEITHTTLATATQISNDSAANGTFSQNTALVNAGASITPNNGTGSTGQITINGKDQETYFARPVLRMMLAQPLQVADRLGQFDVIATVEGSGLSGQAGAVRHGISKALTYYEPGLRALLKPHGFLTRDSRVVERKKYGKAKARRSFQFSKR